MATGQCRKMMGYAVITTVDVEGLRVSQLKTFTCGHLIPGVELLCPVRENLLNGEKKGVLRFGCGRKILPYKHMTDEKDC